jgi:hypothetical protein
MPPEGARLVLASDGIWDSLDPQRACQVIRGTAAAAAAEHLAQVVLKMHGCSDDMTVLVADVGALGSPGGRLLQQQQQQQQQQAGEAAGAALQLVDMSMPRAASYPDRLGRAGEQVGGWVAPGLGQAGCSAAHLRAGGAAAGA